MLYGIWKHPEPHRLVYRTDLKAHPWVPKSTVKDRHNVHFRISNVGNGTLKNLKDFWNNQFWKVTGNFFRPMIEGLECLHFISLIRYGLADNKEDDLQPRVWLIIKPGYWGKNLLFQKVCNNAHAIERMLAENGFTVCVDVIECNVIPLVGPRMTLPPMALTLQAIFWQSCLQHLVGVFHLGKTLRARVPRVYGWKNLAILVLSMP